MIFDTHAHYDDEAFEEDRELCFFYFLLLAGQRMRTFHFPCLLQTKIRRKSWDGSEQKETGQSILSSLVQIQEIE